MILEKMIWPVILLNVAVSTASAASSRSTPPDFDRGSSSRMNSAAVGNRGLGQIAQREIFRPQMVFRQRSRRWRQACCGPMVS